MRDRDQKRYLGGSSVDGAIASNSVAGCDVCQISNSGNFKLKVRTGCWFSFRGGYNLAYGPVLDMLR